MSDKKKWERIQEMKEDLAKKEFSYVIRARTQDVRSLASVLNVGDLVLRRLRDRLGIDLDAQRSLALIEKFHIQSKEIVNTIDEMAKEINFKYKKPKWARDEEEDEEIKQEESLNEAETTVNENLTANNKGIITPE